MWPADASNGEGIARLRTGTTTQDRGAGDRVDERGLVYTPLRDGRGEWPTGSFGDEIAHLRGVRPRVVSRESLISDKTVIRSDAVTAAKDRADVASLLRRR